MKTLPNDISRCANANCPLKNDCLRWTDKGKGLVCYSHFEPENNKCKEQIKKMNMNTLKDIFVSYEIAEKLKEIGFNDDCIAFYTKNDKKFIIETNTFTRYNFESDIKIQDFNSRKVSISAPTYEQVFKWFREKGYYSEVAHTFGDFYGNVENIKSIELYNTEATKPIIYLIVIGEKVITLQSKKAENGI